MKKPEIIRSPKPPAANDFLWRYFDIHKFLKLLHDRTVRFARMDQFEDPLEGIPISALVTYAEKVNLNLVKNVSLSELILDKTLFEPLPLPLQKKLNAINAIQRPSFVSCWFADATESVAMWNLYANADGVAVKVQFGKLVRQLVMAPARNLSAYYGGRVSYQNLTNVYRATQNNSVGRVALRKDSSFKHESEFRFVVRVNDHHNAHTGLDSQPLALHQLNMKVICHPRMPRWKKENIRQLLRQAQLEHAFEESAIRLRS
ncbi:MAG: hypothetical protein ACK576_08890 [Cyclobacteriaceae bacterium]